MFGSNFQAFGFNEELALSDRVGFWGRYGYSSYPNTTVGDINPNYWTLGLAFLDLFAEGAIAGMGVGQPFIEGEIGNATQINFEAFYNFPLTRNIRITPLIQGVVNLGNQGTNGTILTGTIRTVFSF